MTVEPSWLIDTTAEAATHMKEHLEEIRHLRVHGVLVSDPRLQAIADAWNGVRPSEKEMLRDDWPMLAPVIALLDALTEEDTPKRAMKPACKCGHVVSKHRRIGLTAYCTDYTCGCKAIHEAAPLVTVDALTEDNQ